jgi:tripartite-type tricarboxylate transporter receptor subunit TctC
MIRTMPFAALLVMILPALFATPGPAVAAAIENNYPVRPVRLIVPFAPGGGIDFLGRLVAQNLGQELGQQFVVDNRAGAGGVVGTGMAAAAAPDGYTLLLGFIGPISISPNLEKVPYDPVRAFTLAGMLAATYHVLVVHTSVSARTVKDLIALARAKPGSLSFASAGIGSPPHLVGQLFMTTAGIDVTHIPYKGSGPAAIGLLSGEAQMQFGSITAVMPHVRTNRLAALAVTSPNRSALLPEVPTLAESGLPGVDVKVWYALLAPAATPRGITARLNTELARLAASPEYRQQLEKEALEPLSGGRENFSAFVKADLEKWAKVVKAAGIKPN